MEVTAAKATTLSDAATGGQAGVATADGALKGADYTRQHDRADLLKLMSTVVSNLNKKLPRNDGRWLAFLLRMPITPTMPTAPQNVTAMLAEGGAIVVQCDPVALATRYRGRMLIVRVEDQYRLVFKGVDPMGSISGVQPGGTVQIIMQAVNETSQSVPSEPVFFTIPAALCRRRQRWPTRRSLRRWPRSRLTGMGLPMVMALFQLRLAVSDSAS